MVREKVFLKNVNDASRLTAGKEEEGLGQHSEHKRIHPQL